MNNLKQLILGLLAIGVVLAALFLSDKYLKKETESYSDQSHNPSNRLQKIRDGMREN